MKTIWLKTKYDTEIDMEIPHSQNFANAMYGFMEMGARIERYHKLQDISVIPYLISLEYHLIFRIILKSFPNSLEERSGMIQ